MVSDTTSDSKDTVSYNDIREDVFDIHIHVLFYQDCSTLHNKITKVISSSFAAPEKDICQVCLLHLLSVFNRQTLNRIKHN